MFSGVAMGAIAAQADPAYKVTNGSDSGPGSLRDALASGVGKILISPSLSVITITDTLIYSGTEPLEIHGSGQLVDGGGRGNTLLEVSEGADLAITNLAFTDGGGYQLLDGGGEGILLNVPKSRMGVVRLDLTNVKVTGVGDIGVHVLDCDIAECGNGNDSGGDGSAASVEVTLKGIQIDDVGHGQFDADGLRVDERGPGDISLRVVSSSFTNIGADGIELDEGDEGDVVLLMNDVVLSHNGGYCAAIRDIDNPEDPSCIDDGELDLDDGFDVDEAGAGSITGRIVNAQVKDNLDEGLDFDESGDGGFDLQLVNIRAYNNADEGIKLSAEGSGDLVARLARILVTDSDDDGVQIEQDGDGRVAVTVTGSFIGNNAKKDLKVEQSSDQDRGTLRVRGSSVENIDVENVDRI
jgi:hypothetical protein